MIPCTHGDWARPVEALTERVCPDCVRIHSRWLHLRGCLTCGFVGCCDSSPNQHASHHAAADGHPLVRTLEPDEDWAWCFVDEAHLEPA